MAANQHLKTLVPGGLLLTLLLFGCATGRPQQPVAEPAPAVPTSPTKVVQQPPQPSVHQPAMNAFEENDYQAAVRHFRRSTQKEALPSSDLYYYAKALYETGDYAAAIEIYSQYLTELGRRGDYFLAAVNERNSANEKLQQQQASKAKTVQAESTFNRIAASLEANWLVVKVQTDNRVASFTEPLTGMEMLLVPGGCYQMGAQLGAGKQAEKPGPQVCVNDFYLGKYEVTQEQWQKVMGYNPSQSSRGDDFPVESVSWTEAVEFAEKLSGKIGNYRLPTDAEWEYAARSGGKKEIFSGGNSVNEVAWHEDNSGGASHPVGRKRANGLGFYDMSGNVYEWCFDGGNSSQQGPERSLRGGGWDSRTAYQKTGYRRANRLNYQDDDTGFRLALPLLE